MADPMDAHPETRHVAVDDPRAVLVARAECEDGSVIDLGGWTEPDGDAFREWALGQLLRQMPTPGPPPGRQWRLTIVTRQAPAPPARLPA